MNPIVRNIFAVIAGVVAGSLINLTIVNFGPSVVPLPEGVDLSTPEKMRESMKLFTPVNFVCPFLAHALGTLVGAFVAAKVAISHKWNFALGMGTFFFVGGVAAVAMLGGPLWFIAVDLVFAYFPMAYAGGRLAIGGRPKTI